MFYTYNSLPRPGKKDRKSGTECEKSSRNAAFHSGFGLIQTTAKPRKTPGKALIPVPIEAAEMSGYHVAYHAQLSCNYGFKNYRLCRCIS